MRNRGIVLSMLAALVLVPFGGPAQAESVVVGHEGLATTHAAGMPKTAEPWRTLVEARLTTDKVTNVWRGTAKLGGAIPAGKTVSVSWVPGKQHPQGCEPVIQLTQTATAVGADHTVSLERTVQPGYFPMDPDPALTCLMVHVWTEDTVSDQLTGPMTARTMLAGAEARPAGPLRVAAGRTTPVLLMVTSHVRGTTNVAVAGTGPGLRMRNLSVGPLAANQTRPVVARVTASGIVDSELALTARDDVASSSFDQSWKIVAREIEAQRPLPGRYTSTDGSVKFRITDEHRVARLRTSAVLCEGSGTTRATYPVEIRMPRSGATAAVTQLGTRWLGAQLMTVKPGKVQGVFAFSTESCSMSQTFVAKRQD